MFEKSELLSVSTLQLPRAVQSGGTLQESFERSWRCTQDFLHDESLDISNDSRFNETNHSDEKRTLVADHSSVWRWV